MADRRTKKTAKQIFGYARLNFHMGMRQEKSGCFIVHGLLLLYYLGGIRGYLASAEETVSVQELFYYDEYTLYGNDSLGWLSACDL